MAKKKASAASEVAEITTTYVALKRIRHEGEQYLPGEEIELTEVQAIHLVAADAVKLAVVVAPVVAPVVETA